MSTNGYNGNCNFQTQPTSNGQAAKIAGQQQQFQQFQQQQQQQQIIGNAAHSQQFAQQPQVQSPNFNQSANKAQNHKEKLDEIRQQLQPYMINERPTSSASSTSETSSNYVKHVHGGMYDASLVYQQHQQQANYYSSGNHPPNYVPPPPLNYPNASGGQSSQLTKYLVDINGQLNGNNNSKQMLVSSLNSYAQLLSNSQQSSSYHKTVPGNTHNSSNLIKSELTTSPIDDHHNNGQQQQQQFVCNSQPTIEQAPCTNLQTAKLQAWSVRQTKSQSPVIMQSVKSTQVQKPILQTACAPIVNGPHSGPQHAQQTPPPPQQTINSSSMLNSYQRSQVLNSRMAFNEKSLQTDLVQLNPNIAKKFLSKVIGLEAEPIGAAYQKQQMPLPDPPPKSSISNSPVYSVISDKSNLSSNLTANLNSLEHAMRTSSALSNCSSSSKFTSYSNASSINQPPPYKPTLNSKPSFLTAANQTLQHANPISVNPVNSNFIVESEPQPPPYESFLNSSTSSSSNYIETNHQTHANLILNSNLMLNHQQPVDPPSYASSVAVLIKQKNQQIDMMNSKAKNGAIKINRPLPPLPNERPDEVRSTASTPIQQQTGPPLPPKPSKLTAPPDHNAYMTDDLDCSSAAFNATSNLQLLQKQLEQHLNNVSLEIFR